MNNEKKLTEADERASLIERLYSTEAHARIIDKDEEQPLTVLLRDVRQFLEAIPQGTPGALVATDQHAEANEAPGTHPAVSTIRAMLKDLQIVLLSDDGGNKGGLNENSRLRAQRIVSTAITITDLGRSTLSQESSK